MLSENDPWIVQLVKRVDIFNGLTPHDVHRIFAKGFTQIVPR